MEWKWLRKSYLKMQADGSGFLITEQSQRSITMEATFIMIDKVRNVYICIRFYKPRSPQSLSSQTNAHVFVIKFYCKKHIRLRNTLQNCQLIRFTLWLQTFKEVKRKRLLQYGLGYGT